MILFVILLLLLLLYCVIVAWNENSCNSQAGFNSLSSWGWHWIPPPLKCKGRGHAPPQQGFEHARQSVLKLSYIPTFFISRRLRTEQCITLKNHQGDIEEIQEPEEKFQNIKNVPLSQMLLKISKGKVQTKSSGTHLKSNLLRRPALSNTEELPKQKQNIHRKMRCQISRWVWSWTDLLVKASLIVRTYGTQTWHSTIVAQPVSFRMTSFHSYETECLQKLQGGQEETDSAKVNTIVVFSD